MPPIICLLNLNFIAINHIIFWPLGALQLQGLNIRYLWCKTLGRPFIKIKILSLMQKVMKAPSLHFFNWTNQPQARAFTRSVLSFLFSFDAFQLLLGLQQALEVQQEAFVVNLVNGDEEAFSLKIPFSSNQMQRTSCVVLLPVFGLPSEK